LRLYFPGGEERYATTFLLTKEVFSKEMMLGENEAEPREPKVTVKSLGKGARASKETVIAEPWSWVEGKDNIDSVTNKFEQHCVEPINLVAITLSNDIGTLFDDTEVQ
jgi:hypothetical protein